MIYKVLSSIDKKVSFEVAQAHCDIPCGIYDPHHAQLAALTVIRMVDLMEGLVKEHKTDTLEFQNSMSRYVAVKEEHAETCKHEIRVIWGDYLKANHLEKYPQVHGLVHKIMQLGSKARQTTDRETAVNLLDAVNEFAEIFWDTKGVKTKKVKAPYKPEELVVYPDL